MSKINLSSKTIKLSKNLQLAIPKSYGLQPGETVKVLYDQTTGDLTIKKIPNPVERMYGILRNLKNYSSNEFLEEKKAQNNKRNLKLGL
jgi:hypothetical protein